MKDPGIPGHDKTNGVVLTFGEPLGGDIGLEFEERNRFLNALYVLLADSGNFINDAGNSRNRDLCSTGNVLYADL